jgi:hypothetical protein
MVEPSNLSSHSRDVSQTFYPHLEKALYHAYSTAKHNPAEGCTSVQLYLNFDNEYKDPRIKVLTPEESSRSDQPITTLVVLPLRVSMELSCAQCSKKWTSKLG